jgi:hypothetical protein
MRASQIANGLKRRGNCVRYDEKRSVAKGDLGTFKDIGNPLTSSNVGGLGRLLVRTRAEPTNGM